MKASGSFAALRSRSAAAAAFALLIAGAASAEVAIRAGLEAPLLTHDSRAPATTVWLTDSFQPAIDVLLSVYPIATVGLDLELREGFAATGSGHSRSGTAIGPGLTLRFAPLYVRGSYPIHLEPGGVGLDLRAAAGLTVKLAVLSLYLECAFELPLSGPGLNAFDTQQIALGGGAWLKF